MMKFFSIILFLFLLVASSCKSKSDTGANELLEQYFETNVLNRNFIVNLAVDKGTDLTANYSGYVFVLLKTDYYHGPMKATKDGTVFMGDWSSNADYSKLTITLPSPPSEFGFLTRNWRFTSKKFPTLELAPWGSTEELVLHMYRQ
ncbi:MAG: hypothetical protein ABI416_11275 [Ginsengibacter sp.]